MSRVSFIHNLKTLTTTQKVFTLSAKVLKTPRVSRAALSLTGGALLGSGLYSATKYNYSILYYGKEGGSSGP